MVEEDGKFLGALQDITEQKLTEIALKDNEELFRTIFEQAAVGIAQVSPYGDLLMINQKLCDILGYSKEELLKLNFRDITHPDDLEQDLKSMQTILNREAETFSIEKRYFHKNNHDVWVKIFATVVRNRAGYPKYAIGIVDDINDSKIAEEKIKQQNKELVKINHELDEFVYRTSHDLRAPLASVLGLINVLRIEKDERQKNEYIDLIERSVKKLDSSIREILDLSRNSRLDLEIKPIDLKTFINSIFDELSHTRGYDSIRKIISIDESFPFYADKRRLKIILSNLISNAINYHNPYVVDKYIEVSGKINEQEIEITVTDNGTGIEKHHMEHIFKMFYRATTCKSGSGLGLYIVKESMEKLNGKIFVSSELNKGTSFRLHIPNYSPLAT